MDISILKKKPELTTRVVLTITPLAPLSMVDSMPGSFYQTVQFPTKKMVCGLFENLLGWHFGKSDRTMILKELKKTRKKHSLGDTENISSGSSYSPLLMDYFEIIEEPKIADMNSLCFYTDYWNRCYRRADADVHINGCRNFDIKIINEKNNLMANGPKESIGPWMKENNGLIPMFYTIPTQREYVDFDGKFKYTIDIDEDLYTSLKDICGVNNICYLGNSEGWVDIKIEKL